MHVAQEAVKLDFERGARRGVVFQTTMADALTRLTRSFADPTHQLFAGRWSATPGKWRVRYSDSQLCVMTAGRAAIENSSGERLTVSSGDVFVLPAGFAGTWEVLEDSSMLYSTLESRP